MELPSVVGLCAGALTTVAFLPQVLKAWRTKSTKDLSLITFVIFWLGVSLWLAYGILINDLPIILANSITFVMAMTIGGIKLKYK